MAFLVIALRSFSCRFRSGPFFGAGRSTPADELRESNCDGLLRRPRSVFPFAYCSISSRTNSPACVEGALAFALVFFSSFYGLLFGHIYGGLPWNLFLLLAFTRCLLLTLG